MHQSKLGRTFLILSVLALLAAGMGWVGFIHRRQVVRNSVLFDSVVRNDLPKVQELLALNADPNVKLLDERPEGAWNFCKQMVGSDPRESERGRTALMIAAEGDQAPVVKALLEGGARVDLHDSEGRTALHFAVSNYRPDTPAILLLLIQHNADPNARMANGRNVWDLVSHNPALQKALKQAVSKK